MEDKPRVNRTTQAYPQNGRENVVVVVYVESYVSRICVTDL